MDITKSEVYLTLEKETLVKIIDNKRDCIKMLKQRIDKAIKLIENYNVFCDDNVLKVAINILKGSDKE